MWTELYLFQQLGFSFGNICFATTADCVIALGIRKHPSTLLFGELTLKVCKFKRTGAKYASNYIFLP